MDIRDILEYNWFSRRKFLEGMAKLPWAKVIEKWGASFESMRDIFLHSTEAEQGWLRRLAGRGEWPRHDYDKDFHDIEAMRKYVGEVEAESRTYFGKLGIGDFDKLIPYDDDRPIESRVRVEDILMHVVEEEVHHRGELLCLIWQIDIEPPLRDWLDWIAETHVKTSR